MLLSVSFLLSAYKQIKRVYIVWNQAHHYDGNKTSPSFPLMTPLFVSFVCSSIDTSSFNSVSQNYARLRNVTCQAQSWGVQLPFKFQLFFEDVLERIQNRKLLSEIQDDNFTKILLRGKLNSLKLEVRAFIVYLML